MLHDNYFKFFELESGHVISLGHMWDGNLENAERLLGENVKFAIPLFVNVIHYKRTKKDKPYRVLYCTGLDGESAFADFNNVDILRDHAYVIVGMFKRGFFQLKKFHKLKVINNGKEQESKEDGNNGGINFGRVLYFDKENNSK